MGGVDLGTFGTKIDVAVMSLLYVHTSACSRRCFSSTSRRSFSVYEAQVAMVV